MIHGDCSSRGCYAMTDEQIAEIYALARESFFGGQKSFQMQAYPFRMTPLNMAKHRNSPHMAFWKMLKQGYDHFEVTRLEPKVDVCEKRYVFDAESTAASSARPTGARPTRCRRTSPPRCARSSAGRDPDRRADQPRHAGRAGQDRRRRRHEPDLPGGGEVAWRPRRDHSHRARHHPGARQSAGAPHRDHHRQHHEPRLGRSKPASGAALVGAGRLGGTSGGGIGGFFGNLFGSKSEEQAAGTPEAAPSAEPKSARPPSRSRPPLPRSAARRSRRAGSEGRECRHVTRAADSAEPTRRRRRSRRRRAGQDHPEQPAQWRTADAWPLAASRAASALALTSDARA